MCGTEENRLGKTETESPSSSSSCKRCAVNEFAGRSTHRTPAYKTPEEYYDEVIALKKVCLVKIFLHIQINK